MKNVLIIGGGQMGKIIAKDLSNDYYVQVADRNPNVADIVFDVAQANKVEIKELFDKFDLIIGALPSKLGFKPLLHAVENGSDYVDLSFMENDPSGLFDVARKNKSIVFHDCGLSPGLSNLIAGKLNATYNPTYITIMVGGISQDPNTPYGHINTWCVEDLQEEYTRPARFILNGKERLVSPLNSRFWSKHRFDNIDELEGFMSDGLRSLLKLKGPDVLSEITLRHKGHLTSVRKLIGNNTFVKMIKEKCPTKKDMVVMRIECDDATITMIDKQQDDITAMARTTAYSCSAFAQLILEKQWTKSAVWAPESIGAINKQCYNSIIKKLSRHDIVFDCKENK